MRRIAVLTFVTLDGVMQAPGGPDEDAGGGFDQGGWSVGYWDSVMDGIMGSQMAEPFDLLLGRKTYELFASYWPSAIEPGAAELNNAKKFVVSHEPRELGWSNSVLLTGDVVSGIKRLKEQDGPELQVHGSSNLLQTLLKHDLVDEIRLKLFPITIGKGKRLFGDGTVPASFRLLHSEITTTGVIAASYERDGDIKTDSFAAGSQA